MQFCLDSIRQQKLVLQDISWQIHVIYIIFIIIIIIIICKNFIYETSKFHVVTYQPVHSSVKIITTSLFS